MGGGGRGGGAGRYKRTQIKRETDTHWRVELWCFRCSTLQGSVSSRLQPNPKMMVQYVGDAKLHLDRLLRRPWAPCRRRAPSSQPLLLRLLVGGGYCSARVTKGDNAGVYNGR